MNEVEPNPIVEQVWEFERNVQILIIGIYCPICKQEHTVHRRPVRLASGDSVRMICERNALAVTFKVERI